MQHIPSYNACIERTIKEHWTMPALSDYQGDLFTYAEVAHQIARLHSLFSACGIERGDRVALCGRNSSRWGIAFLACLSYGAVAVPILNEFHASQVADIIDHSESKILFVGPLVWPKLDQSRLAALKAIVSLADYGCLQGECVPEVAQPDVAQIAYYHDQADEMAVLNYTSGTTSNSKGVMIPFRALWSNYDFAVTMIGNDVPTGDRVVSMLPMAHTYGMAFEFLFEFLHGVHVTFLTKNASPTILLKALQEIKPRLIVCVPLILEKMVRKAVLPKIQKPSMRILMSLPIVGRIVKNKVRDALSAALGGRFYEAIVGGAAMSREIEAILRDIRFPFTVGYGATECAPILSYREWTTFVPQSCGQAALHMTLKIDSPDPQRVIGEILASGPNVMLGYYKNPEATAQALTDGWYHTGDMGVIDADGNVFIKGRCKNMLLGSNGQNIYPEEIEDVIASQPGVAETLVIQSKKDQKLYALIYPNADYFEQEAVADRDAFFETMRQHVNTLLPGYSQIVGVRLMADEFEKTPKKSIKRFLYLDTEV